MQEFERSKIFWLSDFHLGAPDRVRSLEREKRLVAFLDQIKAEATEIFILGDLFDFWYEYRRVVPKGYTRILGKLAELSDLGIALHFFVGNHDMWMRGYFEQELGIPVYHGPQAFERQGKKLLVAHGDGLGPGDHRYKFLKKIFRNPVAQGLFGLLPPVLGMGLADFFSRRSRAATGQGEQHFLGMDQEWLVSYCREQLAQRHFDYFIFGHRHLPIECNLGNGSRYLNLGDWILYDTYGQMEGGELRLHCRQKEKESLIVRI